MIDTTTGALTLIPGSPFQAGTSPVIFALDPAGQFAYAANCGSIATCGAPGTVVAYTVDGITGALSLVDGSPFPAGTGAFGVAVDPSGQFAYVTNFGSNNLTAYRIDGLTGALAAVGNVPAGSVPVSIAVTAGPTPPPAATAAKK
jgi:DNA-binding beta-propeller fold protein YncE